MIVWWYGVGQYDCDDDLANKVFEDVALVAWESLALPWAAPINQHAQSLSLYPANGDSDSDH